MKKILPFILVISILSSIIIALPITASATTSGSCGNGLVWSFNDGTLAIWGTGLMSNWSYSETPWYSFNYKIKNVVISDGVTSIGSNAFYSCTNLTSVTIAESVKSIGDAAFSTCRSLTSITIPEGATSIGNHAFYDCTSLVNIAIPNGITSLGVYAFGGCSSLRSVEIGNGVKSIDYRTFNDCVSLESIIVSENNIYYSSDECGILYNKNKTTLILYPRDNELRTFIIPDSIIDIGEYAFYNCSNLTNITIPDGVTKVGSCAFYGCSALASLTLPGSVTNIGDKALFGCISLTSITVLDDNKNFSSDEFGVLYDKERTKLIQYPKRNAKESFVIPDSVINIGYGAFYNCSRLKSITISANIKNIDGQAFEGCKGITSITFPNGITSIGYGAFCDCTELTEVYYNGTEEEWYDIYLNSNNDALINATKHFISIIPEEYHINSIIIKDKLRNELSTIPTGVFLATVSFTNVSSSKDTVIVLAQYTETGAFKGLMYIQTEDIPTSSTIKISIPVDNTKGDVSKLKAFCWESFGSLTPMGNSISFPTE